MCEGTTALTDSWCLHHLLLVTELWARLRLWMSDWTFGMKPQVFQPSCLSPVLSSHPLHLLRSSSPSQVLTLFYALSASSFISLSEPVLVSPPRLLRKLLLKVSSISSWRTSPLAFWANSLILHQKSKICRTSIIQARPPGTCFGKQDALCHLFMPSDTDVDGLTLQVHLILVCLCLKWKVALCILMWRKGLRQKTSWAWEQVGWS